MDLNNSIENAVGWFAIELRTLKAYAAIKVLLMKNVSNAALAEVNTFRMRNRTTAGRPQAFHIAGFIQILKIFVSGNA
jgi:hypothetical protein